jgi:hypothetical protein
MGSRQGHFESPQASNLLRTTASLFILAVLYWLALNFLIGNGNSADLRSLWLAGLFFDRMDPALIFRMSEGFFTMEPPQAWIEHTLAEGQDIPVYPFLYPPLWAWIASLATETMDYDSFVAAATWLNRCLVPLSFVLAWRILKPAMPLSSYLAIALLLIAQTLFFTDALRNNQLQILVSFLILLAIERQRAGWPILAGAALAVAASLKLYPALFAIIMLVAGERKVFASFVVIGGALGLSSLAVAPWSMHSAMLGELKAISAGYLFTKGNFSFGPLYAALTVPQDEMRHISTAITGGLTEWYAGAKSSLARNLELALTMAAFAALIISAHKTKMRDPLLWPACAFVVSWVSPLAWVYHYITMIVFAPVLIERLGRFYGWCIILLGTAAVAVPARNLLGSAEGDDRFYWVLGSNAGLLVLFLTFILTALGKQLRTGRSTALVPGE